MWVYEIKSQWYRGRWEASLRPWKNGRGRAPSAWRWVRAWGARRTSPTHSVLVWKHQWKCVTAGAAWFARVLKCSLWYRPSRSCLSDKQWLWQTCRPQECSKKRLFLRKLPWSAERNRIVENAGGSQRRTSSSHLDFSKENSTRCSSCYFLNC